MPSFLVLSWALTFGWIPSGNVALEKTEPKTSAIVLDQSGALTQTIELGLTAWDTVTIWTSIETFDRIRSIKEYAPYRSDYSIGIKASKAIGWATFEAGFTHECIHPVLTSGDTGARMYGGSDEVYVKVGGRIGQ